MHLQKLMDIVVKEKKSEPFICIQDLVENGPLFDRFADDSVKRPSRHEIAIFLASWCKRVGFTAEIYRDWLTDYCVDILSKISSSSASQIRHSTKSTINYIHRSDILFSCNCENNIFNARCTSNCPVYDEMKDVYLRNLEEEQRKIQEYKNIAKENKPEPDSLPVTKRYKQQFGEAVSLIKQYLEKGHTKKDITILLNEKGYKTSTGYDWKVGSVSRIAIEKGWAPQRKRRNEKKTASEQLKLF
ncbi:MAG: hypothetical protein GY702_05920 [Desulfobulbaceae bacterium]|nr:hypothetical protein [Desulfobulbaceae bacterium]